MWRLKDAAVPSTSSIKLWRCAVVQIWQSTFKCVSHLLVPQTHSALLLYMQPIYTAELWHMTGLDIQPPSSWKTILPTDPWPTIPDWDLLSSQPQRRLHNRLPPLQLGGWWTPSRFLKLFPLSKTCSSSIGLCKDCFRDCFWLRSDFQTSRVCQSQSLWYGVSWCLSGSWWYLIDSFPASDPESTDTSPANYSFFCFSLPALESATSTKDLLV